MKKIVVLCVVISCFLQGSESKQAVTTPVTHSVSDLTLLLRQTHSLSERKKLIEALIIAEKQNHIKAAALFNKALEKYNLKDQGLETRIELITAVATTLKKSDKVGRDDFFNEQSFAWEWAIGIVEHAKITAIIASKGDIEKECSEEHSYVVGYYDNLLKEYERLFLRA